MAGRAKESERRAAASRLGRASRLGLAQALVGAPGRLIFISSSRMAKNCGAVRERVPAAVTTLCERRAEVPVQQQVLYRGSARGSARGVPRELPFSPGKLRDWGPIAAQVVGVGVDALAHTDQAFTVW